MAGIRKQGIDKPVSRSHQRDTQRPLEGSLLLRVEGNPGHILLAGDGLCVDRRILRLQLGEEILHAGLAAGDGTRMGRQTGIRREELREVLIHPAGNAPMLPGSQAGEQTAIALRVLPDFGQSLTDALSQLRESLSVLKLLVYPYIPPVLRQPAGAVPPIVGNVERLVAGRWSRECRTRHGVGIIHASHLLVLGIGLSSRQPHQTQHQNPIQQFHVSLFWYLLSLQFKHEAGT